MTVVCATDFSENARRAARSAAAMARSLRVPLWLVHVTTETADAAHQPVPAELLADSQELREQFGIEVEPRVVNGSVHEKVIALAREAGASLIVISALGAKKQQQWLLGSAAERIAQCSPVPVLVVRDAAAIEAWTAGERPLRVMVGIDLGPTSRGALRWAEGLRRLGPCNICVAQIVWPFGEQQRLGISPFVEPIRLNPTLHTILERDLRAWTGTLQGDGETTFVVSSSLGRVDCHLASLATESLSDVLVVGAHQRSSAARLWQGSVSRGAIHYASSNVVCVPHSAAMEQEIAIPTYRAVLIPTDFSPLGNRAVPVGYGVLAGGGVVHLLHVATSGRAEGSADPRERLRALIPAAAAGRDIATEVHVLEGEDVSTAIWHAAGRLGVDVICMSTHGHSGASRLVFGSQAQEVVRRSRQPVLLVPPEPEA
jgi:nucleotide-binding universal stress UspA family protein